MAPTKKSNQNSKDKGKTGVSPAKKHRFIDLSHTLSNKNNLYVQRCKGRFILAFGVIGEKDSRRKAWAEAFKKGRIH